MAVWRPNCRKLLNFLTFHAFFNIAVHHCSLLAVFVRGEKKTINAILRPFAVRVKFFNFSRFFLSLQFVIAHFRPPSYEERRKQRPFSRHFAVRVKFFNFSRFFLSLQFVIAHFRPPSYEERRKQRPFSRHFAVRVKFFNFSRFFLSLQFVIAHFRPPSYEERRKQRPFSRHFAVRVKFFNFSRFFFYHCSSSLLIFDRLRTKREENNVHFQDTLP